MTLLGKVLWWDARDQNGIVKDPQGRKFYFDISVIETRSVNKIKPGLIMRFEWNSKIKDALCAHKVAAANLKERSKLKRAAENSRQMTLSE